MNIYIWTEFFWGEGGIHACFVIIILVVW